MKRIISKAFYTLAILSTTLSLFLGASFSSLAAEADRSTDTIDSFTPIKIEYDAANKENVKFSSRFYELIFGKKGNKEEKKELLLCPSGNAFGILIKEDGITVCTSNTSEILAGDRIIKIGNVECINCSDVYDAVSESGGAPLKITLIRDGVKTEVTATPKYSDGEYKLGITLRAQSAGIGTVTFVDPNTLSFGGLGHAVSDAESGEPVTVKSGIASEVTLGACKKGTPGKAGELSGILNKNIIGEIYKNTECGVFGKLNSLPQGIEEAVAVASKNEVKVGEAEIISTIKNGKTAYYKIEITDIDYTSTGSKSFKIKVTDPTLISLTGGIVRGMSGSPIIQNGKLVGAVTHVMVADPTEGYGIFIENMLSAAQNQVMPKAA